MADWVPRWHARRTVKWIGSDSTGWTDPLGQSEIGLGWLTISPKVGQFGVLCRGVEVVNT
jgi:hypothetical protein